MSTSFEVGVPTRITQPLLWRGSPEVDSESTGRSSWTGPDKGSPAKLGREVRDSHGFRSPFRDWAAEATTYPSDMVEMALAHTISNKVEAAYRRGDMFEKRLTMMDARSQHCGRISCPPS